MMFEIMGWVLGPPQIVALLVLFQRGLEELHSIRNTRRLLRSGATEEGADYYPVVAVTHLGWIAAMFLLIPGDAEILWPLVYIYLVLQFLRYWTISMLGQYWTHRIITLPEAPIVNRGPYAFVRHPNYWITKSETFILPLCFGAFGVAVIFGLIWYFVLQYKIKLEDDALAIRRSSGG